MSDAAPPLWRGPALTEAETTPAAPAGEPPLLPNDIPVQVTVCGVPLAVTAIRADGRAYLIEAEPAQLGTPRGNDTSRALTVIRRARAYVEDAHRELEGPTEYEVDGGTYREFHDPDAADMRAALDVALGLLSRWQRTGRPRKS